MTVPEFALSRLLPPDIEPVTLEEMKRHLREYDTLSPGQILDITAAIKSAREWVEDETGRALIDQTWRLAAHAYSEGRIQLRKSPVIQLVSVASVDDVGAQTPIGLEGVELFDRTGKWPYITILGFSSARLLIDFRAGYADRTGSPQQDAGVVPERYKLAMKLYAEAYYDRDKELMPLLIEAARNLIKPERVDLQSA